MWMGNNRSSIQNEQNGNDNLLIKAIRHSHSVRNQCICFLWIYCPYFNKLYRNSERNDNIGLPLASLGMALCMFTFAKEQYLYAFTLYIASTTVFILLLYWDLYKIRQRKQKRKREKTRRKS